MAAETQWIPLTNWKQEETPTKFMLALTKLLTAATSLTAADPPAVSYVGHGKTDPSRWCRSHSMREPEPDRGGLQNRYDLAKAIRGRIEQMRRVTQMHIERPRVLE